jgi:small multidrug resistance family-3 protein
MMLRLQSIVASRKPAIRYHAPMRLDLSSKGIALVVLFVASLLEVGGDAIIRKGLRGSGLAVVAAGFIVLGGYGVVVNLLQLDFSRLLGAYVGIFALTSVVFGKLVFAEQIAQSTWIGLAVVIMGSLIIQLGGN